MEQLSYLFDNPLGAFEQTPRRFVVVAKARHLRAGRVVHRDEVDTRR
jgi:hypothetical protein